MRRFIPLPTGLLAVLALLAMLTACSDVQTDRANAEAARLSAQAQLTQAQAQATQTQAFIDAQNARADDLQMVVVLAVVLAALSMAVSVAMVFMLHRIARAQPTIVYQIQAPPERYEWPEERARRRALAQIGNEGKL